MKYEEYLAKRTALTEELNGMLDASEEDFNAKKAEIDALDTAWDQTAQRMADLKVLSDNQRVLNIQETKGVDVVDGIVTAQMIFAPDVADAKSDSYTNAWARS